MRVIHSEDDETIKKLLCILAEKTQGEVRTMLEVISCRLGYGHISDLQKEATIANTSRTS